MKTLQFTIYDIVGYLLPGAVSVAALIIFYWSAFEHEPFIVKSATTPEWILFGIISYFVGHFTQAIANQLLKLRPSTADLLLSVEGKTKLAPELLNSIKVRALQIAGLSEDFPLTPSLIWEICDNYVQQKCKTESRDLYVYREGFYRGVFISFFALGVAFAFRVFSIRSIAKFGEVTLILNSPQVTILGVLCFLASALAFFRHRRFGQYLVKYAIFSSLIVREESKKI